MPHAGARPRLNPFSAPLEAEALRRRRLGSNLRLLDVARRSGLSLGKLSMVERGLVPLTPELRRRIERALGPV